MSVYRNVKRWLIVALVVTSLGIAGFAACSKPYNSPVVEEPMSSTTAAFEGLEAQLKPGQTLHLLYIHGMCTHGQEWVDARTSRLASALGVERVESSPVQTLTTGIELHERRLAKPEGKLRITFVVWSQLTAPHKRDLLFDARAESMIPEGQFPFERALLNDRLKVELLNDCLADAVIYTGPNGDLIRSATEEALCEALGGAFDLSDRVCTFIDGPTDPLVIVTESLGSKVLFDAVRELWSVGRTQSAGDRDAFARRVTGIQYLYMIANQLPILDLADHPSRFGPVPAVEGGGDAIVLPSSLAEFLAIRRMAVTPKSNAEAGVAGARTPFTVVAFTDPNDLLSYRLVPEVVADKDVRLINVLVSNAPTIVGWIERPDTAHIGYGDNSWVVRYLVEGYPSDEAEP